jgi:pilus assembly protein TadC
MRTEKKLVNLNPEKKNVEVGETAVVLPTFKEKVSLKAKNIFSQIVENISRINPFHIKKEPIFLSPIKTPETHVVMVKNPVVLALDKTKTIVSGISEKIKVFHIKQEIKKDIEETKDPDNEKLKEARQFEKTIKKEIKKDKKTTFEQKRFFLNLIKNAGIDTSFENINKKIMILSVLPIIVATIVLVSLFVINNTFLSDAIMALLAFWIFGTIGLYLLLWAAFFVYIDMRIYKRRKEIEEVFPDFLQLTAANINAGMPIDRALWFAIRPKFGVLAKEMEQVAKATMVGESLQKALTDFSNKYDSITVQRSLNLLMIGLESGGEVGDLLSRIADNIRETEIIKKEMASSVTTYVIFILFATLGAAPFLFGLTTELIVIMKSIMGNIQVGEGSESFGGMGGMLSSTGNSITVLDYQLFAITSICLSSIFAAIIISVIQKGNAKESLKNIPFYIAIGLINYAIAFKALNLLLGGFFS